MEEILTRLLEKVENRYYGKYRGFVVDNADPENRGRLRLSIPSVLGNDVVSGWALPCAPYGGAEDQGFFFIPENDAGVWVEFEAGNLDYPIWVGTFWAKPGGASEVPKPADEQRPPTRKIIRTLKGHTIEIEDKDDEEVFVIQYRDGEKTNTVTMNNKGIEIIDANENKITMNNKGIEIIDANENKITMDNKGSTIEDKNSNKIEMNTSAINIFPATECNLGSGAVNMVNNLPACLFSGAPHALDAKGHAKVIK